MMLLAVVSGNAVAEWVRVTSSDTATFYADPATIRKAGNTVKMWGLLDHKTAQGSANGKPYISDKEQREYDCKEEQSRLLYLSFHSGNMGGGEVVFSHSDPQKWEPVSPASIGELLWKFACGKK